MLQAYISEIKLCVVYSDGNVSLVVDQQLERGQSTLDGLDNITLTYPVTSGEWHFVEVGLSSPAAGSSADADMSYLTSMNVDGVDVGAFLGKEVRSDVADRKSVV